MTTTTSASTPIRSEWVVQVIQDGTQWLAQARPIWMAVGPRSMERLEDAPWLDLGVVGVIADENQSKAFQNAEDKLRSMRVTLVRPPVHRESILDQLTYWGTFAADQVDPRDDTPANVERRRIRSALDRLEAHGLIQLCGEDRLLAVADEGFMPQAPSGGPEIRYEDLVPGSMWVVGGIEWKLVQRGARGHRHRFVRSGLPAEVATGIERFATLQSMNSDGWVRG